MTKSQHNSAQNPAQHQTKTMLDLHPAFAQSAFCYGMADRNHRLKSPIGASPVQLIPVALAALSHDAITGDQIVNNA